MQNNKIYGKSNLIYDSLKLVKFESKINFQVSFTVDILNLL